MIAGGGDRRPGPLRLFLRGLFLQSGWNRERMQGLGFTFALLPWAPSDPKRCRAFIQRHLSYVNTSPPLSGLILGTVAAEEERLAEAERRAAEALAQVGSAGPAEERPVVPDDEVARTRTDAWKRRLEGPLAGLGDRIFWGWLRPLLGVVGVFWILGGVDRGALPAAFGGRGGPASGDRALEAVALAFLLYNGPHLITRLRAVGIGLRAGRGSDPDSSLRLVGQGLGLTRLSRLLEWIGPIGLGALLGRLLATLGRAAAASPSGSLPALALLAAGILLGAGAGRFRVPPERVGLGVLAFLALVTA